VDEAVARQRLHALLADLDSSSSTLSRELGDPGELSRIDQHPAEAASELAEAQRDAAILTVVGGQRAEVVAALARLDDGTYGTCVECGAPMPEARLQARPEAARCMSCQQELENAR
jgi:DnaK suppressor protein